MSQSKDPPAPVIGPDVPFNELLGIRFERAEGESMLCRLTYSEALLGNPQTGTLFGGALFSLLDFALGTACGRAVAPKSAVATIDLRLDYARANEPGRDVFALGECYRLTRQIAFARGFAFHDRNEPPLASAQGTFMVYEVPPEWREKQP